MESAGRTTFDLGSESHVGFDLQALLRMADAVDIPMIEGQDSSLWGGARGNVASNSSGGIRAGERLAKGCRLVDIPQSAVDQ